MASWLNSVRWRLWALLRRRRFEQDLQDEMAFHLEMREAQLRASAAAAARTEARRQFGSLEKVREELRDTWALAPALGHFVRDLRYAGRALRRRPGFALVVVLTLGLGIGANTAFFSVVNAALLRPVGYADAARLVSLYEAFPRAGIDQFPFSALDFEDLRTHQRSFEALAAYKNVPFELSGDATPEYIQGAKISADLLPTLGVAPVLGRGFSADEDRPGVRVVLMSWGLWTRRYARDRTMLGRTILLDRQPYTVIGIMPASFVFPRRGMYVNGEPADVWVPMAFTPRERAERAAMHNNSVIGRLRPDASLEAARAELDDLGPQIGQNYPPVLINAGFSPKLSARPLSQELTGEVERPLWMLLAAAGLVLLVACANIANLILSRAATRTREFAVRLALGARRRQLVRLLLCEAAWLALGGAIVGIGLTYLAVGAVPEVLARTLPGFHDIAIDLRVLAFTAALTVATAILFALLPLATLGQRMPGDPLRADSTRATPGARKLRLQRALVAGTIALTVVLLVGAGLFMRSFSALVSTDLGFEPARVVTASMTLPRSAYPTAESVRAFHASLQVSLSALPGVQSAALTTNLPLTTYERRAFTPQDSTESPGMQPMTHLTWVDGAYFDTVGMTFERGRPFVADEDTNLRGVVIVNEKLAETFWPGENPVGKRLKWGIAASPFPWLTVVGVVKGTSQSGVGAEAEFHAYEPFRQFPEFFLNGAVNEFGRHVNAAVLAQGEPQALAGLIRKAVSMVDPNLAIERLDLMDAHVRDVLAPQRAGTWLVSAFAAIALLLASVGIYGLLAFTTSQRSREIAVRMALGAERGEVMRMVIGQGARLVAAGLAGGLAASLLSARLVASLLYQTDPWDPLTFAAVPMVIGVVALAACALPAWRAARVEPTTVLRAE